jgi:hypothetical protein
MTDPQRVTEYMAANCSTVLAGGNNITGWMEWEDFGVLMGTYFILCFASHCIIMFVGSIGCGFFLDHVR